MVETGSLIVRRYEIQNPIGGGQMSSVYLAEDRRRPEVPVVVKLLNSSHPDAIRTELFTRETRALQQLDHPSIIKILDFGWWDERACHYIVLPYYARTLLDELARHTHLVDHQWCWPIMQALADALGYAHAEGIIHRDIKPSNVLLDEHTQPILTDFGISRLIYQLGSGLTLSPFWSPGYAAPERRRGEQGDERSDIYSLGALFFHILTRQAPLDGGPSEEALKQLRAPQVVALLSRMLAERPEERFPDVGQVVRRIESLAGVLSHRPTVQQALTQSCQAALYNLGHIDDASPSAAIDFLEQELSADGVPPGAILEGDGSISLLTHQLKLVCKLNPDGNSLALVTAQEPHGPNLESQRAESTSVSVAWRISGQVQTGSARGPASAPMAPGLAQLMRDLTVHNRERAQAHVDRIQRRDFVASWERVLRYQELESVEARSRLRYTRMREENGLLIFELNEPPPDGLGWREGMGIAVLGQGDRVPQPIGLLYALTGNVLSVADVSTSVPMSRPREPVPRSGMLILDRTEQVQALRRQRNALVELRAGTTENRRLGDVLADLRRAEFDEPDSDLTFIQEALEADQREAVTRALAARDIFLLQGPPGTGKTTVIAEIILQILAERPKARILVSSQSNTAVNHAISRVAALHKGQPLEVVRLGRMEKIAQGAEDWTLEHRREEWRRQVLPRCEAVLDDLAQRAREHRRGSIGSMEPDVSELRQCEAWIDEADWLLDELDQDRERLAALKDSISDQLQAGLLQEDDDTLPSEVSTLEGSIREEQAKIAEHLDAIRSLLPDEVSLSPAQNLRAEVGRLRSVISSAIESGSGDDPTRNMRSLVREWREVFGLSEAFSAPLLQRANIIAATCLFAGGRQMRELAFDWAIVDEAGRATAPEILVPLIHARRALLVGDERQLPPLLDDEISDERLRQAGIDADGLEQSLFETLARDAIQRRPEALHRLTTQHRMHPAIGNLVSEVFYDGALRHGITAEQRQHGLDWVPRPVVWYSTDLLLNRLEMRRGNSFANQAEADYIERLLERMNGSYMAVGERREVGIIAGYAAQVELLEAHLRPQARSKWSALDIEIATVDGFQGRDRDIVIYSAVRSNRNRTIGFLRDRRRLNVALSRARQLLIIVGDSVTLETARAGTQENPFGAVLGYIRSKPAECAIVPVEVGRR
jgi:serine/threonine protein kinase